MLLLYAICDGKSNESEKINENFFQTNQEVEKFSSKVEKSSFFVEKK